MELGRRVVDGEREREREVSREERKQLLRSLSSLSLARSLSAVWVGSVVVPYGNDEDLLNMCITIKY